MTPETKAAVKLLLNTPQTQAAHALCLILTPQEIPPYNDWLDSMIDTGDVTVVEDDYMDENKVLNETAYHNAIIVQLKAYIVLRVNYAMQNY